MEEDILSVLNGIGLMSRGQETAESLRILFDSTDEGFCKIKVVFDENQKPVECLLLEENPAFQRHEGLSEAVRKRELLKIYANVVLAQKAICFTHWIGTLNRWYEVRVFPVGNSGLCEAAIIFKDITAQKTLDNLLCARERNQAFLLRLGDAIQTLSDSEQIRETVERRLKEYIQVSCVSFLELCGDCSAQNSREEAEKSCAAGRIEVNPALSRLASDSDMVREGRIFAANDTASCPGLTAQQRESFSGLGLRSIIIVPVQKSGNTAACLLTGQAVPRVWKAEEISLVRRTAELTWVNIKRARELKALQECMDFMRTILEHAGDGINLLDLASGKYVYMSPSQEKLLGLTKDEINILSEEELLEHIHPCDQELIVRMREQLAGGVASSFHSDYRWKVGEGEYRWLGDRLELVRDEKGRPRYLVGVSRDITDCRKTEEKLREGRQQALELVKKYEEEEQNKHVFLDILSHELRNPLAAISAGLQVLENTRDENLICSTSVIINRQLKQLCRLVDDLLDMTRISNNRIRLKKETIDLIRVARASVEDYDILFGEKGVILSFLAECGPIFVNADEVRLKQAIGNLLSNALKFTNTGGKVILKLYEENGEAVISVKDSGIGISPAMLHKVFSPFIQAEQGEERSSGGLGLGLAITKNIIEMQGGSVSAYSEGLGRGAEFVIRLPAIKGEAGTKKE